MHELNELYRSSHITRCRLSRFEDYDFYSNKKDFLQYSSVLTFVDLDGKLRVLRPDVTLSLIRRGNPGHFYYSENVYRPDQNSRRFAEVKQSGVDFLGQISDINVNQVIQLALDSLEILADGRDYALDIADTQPVAEILRNSTRQSEILTALSRKNLHELRELNAPSQLIDLLENHSVNQKIPVNTHINVDYSVVSNLNYYNGLVFNGWIDGIPSRVLSGGQYDGLLRAMNSPLKNGMGFAIYLDRLGVDFEDD